MFNRFVSLSIFGVLIMVLAVPLHAGWDREGVIICRESGRQNYSEVCPDGSGGVIVAWEDSRSGVDIYVQRIDDDGNVLWTDGGVAVCTASGHQEYPHIVSDGTGGAIVAWSDLRGSSYDIYAQRIGANGTVQWAVGGVIVCSASGDQKWSKVVSDGSGGAIIVWFDNRNGNWDIYAQRVNAAGTVQWTSNGIAVCSAQGDQVVPAAAPDGSGGAVIAWRDGRGSTFDVYAQRIDSSGTVLWNSNGVAVCGAAGDQYVPALVPIGSGSSIVTWSDGRGSGYDIYAQKIDADGEPLWGANGVVICSAADEQYSPQLVADGDGGAVIAWEDHRNGEDNNDIYMQRIDADADVLWAQDGIAVTVAPGDQRDPRLATDGEGGAIVVWIDARNNSDFDLYAQWIDAGGSGRWKTRNEVGQGGSGEEWSGIPIVCADERDQAFVQIVPDGTGNAIAVWNDVYHLSDNLLARKICRGLRVVTPNGGERWARLSTERITWEVDGDIDVDHFEIGYITGSSYHVINGSVAGTDEYYWSVPGMVPAPVFIKVTAYAKYNPTDLLIQEIYDISDGPADIYEQTSSSYVDGDPAHDTAGVQQHAKVHRSIIVWQDNRDGDFDIYANRALSPWLGGERQICTASGDQTDPQLATDGSYGAIIVWADNRGSNGDIYARKIDYQGNVYWTSDGIAVCTASGDQSEPQIAPDGIGGAILVWTDERGSDKDIYAQRVNPSGSILWQSGGVAVCTYSGDQFGPRIVADGSRGAYIVWTHDNGTDYDVYAAKVDSSGSCKCVTSVKTGSGDQESPQLVLGGSGNAVIVWCEPGSGTDIYVNELSYAPLFGCMLMWGDGEAVCTASGDQYDPHIVTDGNGGAIIAWSDERDGDCRIFAQSVTAFGDMKWTSNGVRVSEEVGTQTEPRIAADGDGGAYVTWQDARNADYDVYYQGIDGSGDTRWTRDIEVCTSWGDQKNPEVTLTDTWFVIAWLDQRNDAGDVYSKPLTEGDVNQPCPRAAISFQYYDASTQQFYSPEDTFLYGCPAGDAFSLIVHVDVVDEDMIYGQDVGTSSIYLRYPRPRASDAFDENRIKSFEFFPLTTSEKRVYADSAATPENGYQTTIQARYIGGCTECEGCWRRDNSISFTGPRMYVSFSSKNIGVIHPFRVKSPDYTADGVVDISDLCFLAKTYYKDPSSPDFNTCFDFNGDNAVNLSDLTFLACHYNHYCPVSSSLPLERFAARSDVEATLDITTNTVNNEIREVAVRLYLTSLRDITTLCLGMENPPGLVFTDWLPAPAFPGLSEAVIVNGRNERALLIAGLCLDASNDAETEVGTIKYIPATKATRIDDVDVGGFSITYGDFIDVNGGVKGIGRVSTVSERAPKFTNYLANNYPNPFNPATIIEFAIASKSHVNLSVYNVKGELVKTLVNEVRDANVYTVQWNGTNNREEMVASGVYFYRIKSDLFTKSKKMILLR